MVKIGSARSSFGNTSPGDQHGGQEVSTQDWYLHSKGWRVFRAKDPAKRELIAKAMEMACRNNDIGYSQATRNTLTANVKPFGYDPSKTTKKVNTDCSALVRCCCLYAGIRVDDFITSSEPAKLLATGAFEELKSEKYTKKSEYLCRGDILDTKTKGHTVVVLTSGAKCEARVSEVVYTLGCRELRNGCIGDDVTELQRLLIQLGYSCGDWGADGEFGDDTEAAVTQFQRDKGLIANGVAGAETIRAIMDGDAVEDGATGTHVTIRGGKCYIRMEPRTDAVKIGVAYSGTTYVYGGQVSSDGWIRILCSNAAGWVSGKYAVLS